MYVVCRVVCFCGCVCVFVCVLFGCVLDRLLACVQMFLHGIGACRLECVCVCLCACLLVFECLFVWLCARQCDCSFVIFLVYLCVIACVFIRALCCARVGLYDVLGGRV